MEVTFNAPIDITVIEELKKNFTSVTVNYIVEFYTTKTINAYIQEFDRFITLWQGAEYDAIGQWTDTDVVNRIKELYQN